MPGEKIRVLVVEDSLVFRSLLVKYINQDPELEVVAVAGDPFEARDAIIKYDPDVMTLDVELPRMDGIQFLRKLMPQYPVRTLVLSTLSNRVFDALQAGAVEFVSKPRATDRSQMDEFVRTELPSKIKIASKAKFRPTYGGAQGSPAAAGGSQGPLASANPARPEEQKKGFSENMLVAIGASTGGTEATAAILESFGPDIPGVVVTQHMPEGFTKMYAERLNQRTREGVTVQEARNGEAVLPGHIYIAPGGNRHMELVRQGTGYGILLRDSEKVNGHKPSVDVLFHSVARAAGDKAVGIILTGMGGDGARGLLAMRNAGARTIGQDESSCVVYGMPRVAYELGAVESQERLANIAKKTYQFLEQIQRRDQ